MKLLFKLNGQKVVLFLVACFAVPGTGMARQVALAAQAKEQRRIAAEQLRKEMSIQKPEKKSLKSSEYHNQMSFNAGLKSGELGTQAQAMSAKADVANRRLQDAFEKKLDQKTIDMYTKDSKSWSRKAKAAEQQAAVFMNLAGHHASKKKDALSAAQIAEGKRMSATLGQRVQQLTKDPSPVKKAATEKADRAALKQQTVQAEANLHKTTEQLRAEKAQNLQLAKQTYAKAAQKRRELGWLGRNIFSRGKNREFKDAQIELLKGNRRLRDALNENRIAKGKATIRDKEGKKQNIDLKIRGNANKTGSTQKAWANWVVGN